MSIKCLDSPEQFVVVAHMDEHLVGVLHAVEEHAEWTSHELFLLRLAGFLRRSIPARQAWND